MSLANKYRPRKLASVIGQPDAVAVLEKYIKKDNLPQTIMFSGPSGVGKSSIAYILAEIVSDGLSTHVVNCGTCEPMEKVREMTKTMNQLSLTKKPFCWILDEFQAMSRAKHAQDGCLIPFEEATRSYFFLCTTDTARIAKTIHTRCVHIKLKPLTDGCIKTLLNRVRVKENIKLDQRVADEITSACDGSARQALTLLDKIAGLKSVAEQIASISLADEKVAAIELARGLMSRKPWPEIAKILKGIKGEDAEGIRRLVLAYANAVLLNGGLPRAFEIIQQFRDNVYDCGHAGLAVMAYQLSPRK